MGKEVSIIPGQGVKGILSLLINLRKRSKVKGERFEASVQFQHVNR